MEKTQVQGVENDLNMHQGLLDRIASEYGMVLDEEGLVVSDYDLKPDDWSSWDEATCVVAAVVNTCSALGYEATRSSEGKWVVVPKGALSSQSVW